MKRFYFLLPVLFAVLILSCKSFDESPKALVNVLLIDAPATWDSVIVEIQGVELDFVPDGRDGTVEKIFLPYEPGDKEVDVSQLVGGVALPVARSEIQMGKITGITLRLGTENALFLDEDRYPLSLPGGNADYSLPLSVDLEQGISYDLILDFDLEKSIQVVNASPLELDFNPTLSAFSGVGRGDISGTTSPTSLKPVIYAIQAGDSTSTHTNSSGGFLFRLEPGTYTLYLDPKNTSYADTVLNVEVKSGSTTTLERITFARK
ncbi:DUF4382 domain-containing protein [Algoriphagus aestuariicola]|uniref:DUF4382 domain-containing protein n=1 Tax=Algoriphagus aestuariicola TaxID=1852016 RepID=A0ABS3BT72_9BACT|nr:DUF4382 domain-containing protein [Algoriphagus aestuariicola]MBN7802282.1 DUF4382 domain-containing protein [Algoriphagus aestuariicola]